MIRLGKIDMDYLIQWMHAYALHFGTWVSLLMAFGIYKDGLPKTEEIFPMFKSALVLSIFVALFSSHTHAHYLSYFGDILSKVESEE